MKQEVIFIDETADIGGAEINLLNIINRLEGKDWTPLVILPEPGLLADRLTAEGVAVHYVPHPPFVSTSFYINHRYRLPNPLGLFLSLWAGLVWTARLTRFLHTHPGNVVHTISTWAHAAGGLAARLQNLPMVWHFQEIVGPQAGWGLYRQMVLLAARVLPARILCISERVAEPFLAEAKVRTKVVLLWNTIDITRFAPGVGKGNGGEKEHEVLLNIVTIGRLTPWKGQEIALDAARHLKGKAVPFRWRLVGDEALGVPGYKKHLQDAISKFGLSECVQMIGWVDDMPSLYQEEDVLVHIPTEPEPFGLVLAEALSAGVPVITTNHGGAAQLVADAGGVIVPPGEALPVAEALCQWWQIPEDRLRAASEARRFALQFFSLDSYVDQLASIYATVLEESHDWQK